MVGGMHWGACMTVGCALQGEGACVAGRMHGRGTLGVCMAGGHVWLGGACVAGETATAADSTHPTGMHSCYL